MKEPTLMQQSRVKVADVMGILGRLRPVSEAGVESLIASIREVGVMKDAIHVRKKKDGSLHLIAGGHRLEAARRLGWEDIEAKVWTGVTDDWARLMEIDDNLAGAEMNALDTAVFLAARKAVYERLHPETRRGVAGAVARWDATEPSSVAFVKATSDKFDLTERQVYKIAAAGAKLGPDEVAKLRSAPRRVTLKDLTEISKIGAPTERYDVVRLLASGEAKTAAQARRSLLQEAGGDVAAPAERNAAFSALMASWKRAPMAARRQFAVELQSELEALFEGGLSGGAEGSDG